MSIFSHRIDLMHPGIDRHQTLIPAFRIHYISRIIQQFPIIENSRIQSCHLLVIFSYIIIEDFISRRDISVALKKARVVPVFVQCLFGFIKAVIPQVIVCHNDLSGGSPILPAIFRIITVSLLSKIHDRIFFA